MDQGRRNGLRAEAPEVAAAMLDAVGQAIIATDPDGRVTHWNPAAERLYGWTREEAIGQLVQTLVCPAPTREQADAIMRQLGRGESWSGAFTVQDRHGRTFLAEVTDTPVFDDEGRLRAVIGISTDISQRAAAEEALRLANERFATALAASPVIVFSQDRDLRYTWIHNPALDYASADVIGRRDGELFERPEDAEETEALKREVLATGQTRRREVRIWRGGTPHVYDLTVQPQRDQAGRLIGVLCAAVDVTERKTTDAVARAAGDTFRHFVEHSPFGVYAVDADFRIVQASAAARRTFRNVQPLIGRDLADALRTLWTEPFASEAVRRFRHTLVTGEPYHAPDTIERRHDIDAVESYDWKVERIVFPDGRPGVVCHFYDLSDRQRYETALRESEARFREMANQTPVILWVTDAAGRTEFVNDAWCTFFGVSRAAAADLDWESFVHPEDVAYREALLTALRERTPFEGRARVRSADGSWRWIAASARPRVDALGRQVGMIGVSADITDQIAASQLEQEAARQKDTFIAVLAHELRNPLAPIRTAVGVMRSAPAGERDLLEQCRDIIDRQVTQMSRLLDDLLDVSRLSHGKLSLQRGRVRVRTVLASAVETVRPAIDDKRHTLLVDPVDEALVLDGDAARLTQVFANLLHNAAKYTNPCGRIDVRVTSGADRVTVSVRDTGIGIPPAMRERIFDLFSQVEGAHDRADGGLGIGLGLTRRLVDMHDGTITVESAGVGHGSVFSVTLPLAGPGASEGRDAAIDDSRVAVPDGRRVLIVDDNVDAADMLATLLDIHGCEVRTSYDGRHALVEAAGFRPHLVLLDLGMPGLDGQTVCRRLRAEPHGAGMVIAAVTGWGQDEDRRRTRDAGFDYHLVKPVDLDAVVALVRGLPARP